MAIIGIFGNLSSGKTLLGVKICLAESKKRKIISNIKLNFPYQHVELDEMINKSFTDPMFFYDSILFLDEFHVLVDARRSSSDLNQKFTMFATQLGKLSCDLIFTSQIFSSQIDLRIRELLDIFFFCKRIDKNGNLILFKRITEQKIFISVEGVIKVIPRYIPISFIFDPKPYFDKYNTRELVLLDRDKYLKK